MALAMFIIVIDTTIMNVSISALMPFSIVLLIAAMVAARFSAKRLIQVGFLITIAGLLLLEFTIQPDFTASDVATGILIGIGLGLILPQTLNLVLSLVPAKDTPETAGLNAAFEQLGNALGVALVGTMMLVSLSAGLEQGINASSIMPAEDKIALTQAVEDGVELVSDSQLNEGLAAAGVDQAVETELLNIYAETRPNAFKSGVAFLLFVALMGLILTAGLPKRMLVGEEEPGLAVAG